MLLFVSVQSLFISLPLYLFFLCTSLYLHLSLFEPFCFSFFLSLFSLFHSIFLYRTLFLSSLCFPFWSITEIASRPRRRNLMTSARRPLTRTSVLMTKLVIVSERGGGDVFLPSTLISFLTWMLLLLLSCSLTLSFSSRHPCPSLLIISSMFLVYLV